MNDNEYLQGLLRELGDISQSVPSVPQLPIPPPLPTTKSPYIETVPPEIPPFLQDNTEYPRENTEYLQENTEYIRLLRKLLNETPIKSIPKGNETLHVEKNFLNVKLQSMLNGMAKIKDLNEIIKKSNEIIIISSRILQINECLKPPHPIKRKHKNNKV
jgi:hypothetical protein